MKYSSKLCLYIIWNEVNDDLNYFNIFTFSKVDKVFKKVPHIFRNSIFEKCLYLSS